MAIEVMQRYENKYVISADRFYSLREKIAPYVSPDEYNKQAEFYTISNLYYDTADHRLIRTSLSKPPYKEKLRIRAYGKPGPEDIVYLEIKKKFNGLVSKRRTKLRLAEAYAFVEDGKMPAPQDYINRQVLQELAYSIALYAPIMPKVCLTYDRQAYFGEHGLRITFDTDVRARRKDLRLELGGQGDPLLEPNVCLMEIKAERALPLWLTAILSQYKIYKTGFSKYGTEFTNFLVKERDAQYV